jgi:vacuolar protein-sorting-associated protein 4
VLKDFEAALEDSNKSVGKEDLQKQVEWTQEYGTDGS